MKKKAPSKAIIRLREREAKAADSEAFARQVKRIADMQMQNKHSPWWMLAVPRGNPFAGLIGINEYRSW